MVRLLTALGVSSSCIEVALSFWWLYLLLVGKWIMHNYWVQGHVHQGLLMIEIGLCNEGTDE